MVNQVGYPDTQSILTPIPLPFCTLSGTQGDPSHSVPTARPTSQGGNCFSTPEKREMFSPFPGFGIFSCICEEHSWVLGFLHVLRWRASDGWERFKKEKHVLILLKQFILLMREKEKNAMGWSYRTAFIHNHLTS